MRNGVLAIHRDGTLALMNDEAYRIFGADARGPTTSAGRSPTCCASGPTSSACSSGAFELSHLPNRAELRLKDLGPRDRLHAVAGQGRRAASRSARCMFFKDLTQVEQLEERERLRDRLAALGEMAAGIAHEVKNPLAGIEVMAGLLRRQVPDSADAQSLLADIISEAKMANAIVVEVLEFVRPIRLQVERTDARRGAAPGGHAGRSEGAARRRRRSRSTCRDELPLIAGRPAPAVPGVHEPADQRVRGARRQGPRRDHGGHERRPTTIRRSPGSQPPTPVVRGRRRRRRAGGAAGADGPDLRPVLHDQAAGLGARAGDRPEDRRRARRADRRAAARRAAARGSG